MAGPDGEIVDLAVPVRDTLKRASADGRVANTVDRSQIWQAYTPQMFRFGALQRALAEALVAGGRAGLLPGVMSESGLLR